MKPIQCKMARAALGMGVRQLAFAADVSPDTVSRFERGDDVRRSTIEALQAALEAAGVEFIPENGSGAGVRIKKSRVS
jgi:transcriptional regulator with XRE-family HTH domain